jgi:two-component system phosphate regulon response regulator PhoB
MRAEIVPRAIFPDYELSDHTAKRRKLSELQGQHPMVLVLSRGGYCPKDRRQAEGLVEQSPPFWPDRKGILKTFCPRTRVCRQLRGGSSWRPDWRNHGGRSFRRKYGMQTVLVVSDDQDTCTLLRTILEADGFRVVCAFDGVSGLATATANVPNVILIDVNLPRMNGLQLLQHLREPGITAFIPIVMISGAASETDLVLSLEQGADDYIVRPFKSRELVARLRAVLRRSGGDRRGVAERRIGPLAIDENAHTVTYQDESVAITHTEFQILDLLAKNAGMAISREQIIQASRKSGHPVLARSVDVHIRSIRRKLKGGANLIVTIRAVGYRLKGIDELRRTE